MKLTILQVCAYSARYGGNFLASLLALDAELMKQGIHTTYLFPEQAKNMQWCRELQKTRKVFFASTNRFAYSTFTQIKNAMKDADVVHSHFELYDCLCALAKRSDQKLIWHLHDSFDDEVDAFHDFINRVQYGILGKNAVLVSPSRYYADYTVKLGFPPDNIYVVENCIDFKRLTSNLVSRGKKYDFLAFGGFYRIKGLDVLLDAARILANKKYKFTIGIVGYPETWKFIDQNYSDLESYIIREEPAENVSQFYNLADVFISASRRECFSYSMLEALYLGLPLISSDVVGSRWAKQLANTATYGCEDSRSLATLMAQCLDGNCWVSAEECKYTSEMIRIKYSIANWVKQIKEIYIGD